MNSSVAIASTPSARSVSELTLAQWRELEKQAESARKALEDLELGLLMKAATVNDKELQEALFAQSKAVSDAKVGIYPAYFYHPQPEWTGGDSMNPSNHVYREGAFMGMRRATIRA